LRYDNTFVVGDASSAVPVDAGSTTGARPVSGIDGTGVRCGAIAITSPYHGSRSHPQYSLRHLHDANLVASYQRVRSASVVGVEDAADFEALRQVADPYCCFQECHVLYHATDQQGFPLAAMYSCVVVHQLPNWF